MTIIALDIQPQYRFSCMAANERRFVNQPERIVDELNRQAQFANKRLLVENLSISEASFCSRCIDAPLNRSGFVFNRADSSCCKLHLLSGLPCPADYDYSVELNGGHHHGACFLDGEETRSSGLIEWLRNQRADTVIIGGLAMEETVAKTAKQLRWYGNHMNIIVNLGACCGYTPETTIKTIYNLREMGIAVVNHAAELVSYLPHISVGGGMQYQYAM